MTTPPERRRPPEPSPADDVVILRLPRAADEDVIAAACTDPEIARWIPVPVPYTRSDARAFLDLIDDGWADGTQATFVIEERAGGRLAGMIGLDRGSTPGRASVGYWLAPAARGRGLATRAVRLLAAWAFEDPGLERLELMTLVGNDASGRVARRAGFRREGTLRRYLPFRETLVDAVMYARLRGDAPDDAPPPARGGAAGLAAGLADALDEWDRASAALGALAAAGGRPAAPLAAEVLDALRDEVSRRAWDPPSIEPRDAADRRDGVAVLLGGLGMAAPDEPAGALVALGWDGNEIDDLLAPFDDDESRLVVAAWLACAARVQRLLAEMSDG